MSGVLVLRDSLEMCFGDGRKVSVSGLEISGDAARCPVARWKRWQQGDQRRPEAHLIAAKQTSIDSNILDEFVVDKDAEVTCGFWINTCLKHQNVGGMVRHGEGGD